MNFDVTRFWIFGSQSPFFQNHQISKKFSLIVLPGRIKHKHKQDKQRYFGERTGLYFYFLVQLVNIVGDWHSRHKRYQDGETAGQCQKTLLCSELNVWKCGTVRRDASFIMHVGSYYTLGWPPGRGVAGGWVGGCALVRGRTKPKIKGSGVRGI